MMQRVRGFAAMIGLIAAIGLSAPAIGQQPFVDKFVLADTIQPVTQGELERAIARANSDGASALIIELDTPGGLLDSMRSMIGAILASKVPVIVYVAPAGARAGSAGFYLLESADVAAMAPGTNAGAAHVVSELALFGKPDDTMMQKVENDAEALLRSYVSKRNRNADAAEAAAASSHSYTAQEALDQHLIDLIASNDWREDLLGWLVNPNIALLFLVGGALLIYLEFNVPGTIVPGALGTLMVLLAIFALGLLPIRFTSVLLLVAALVLLLLEAKFGGHGVLAIAGIICLTFGTLTLIAAPVQEMAISPWVALAVSAAFGSITVFLVRLAVRARRLKSKLGPSALVGRHARAMEALNPEGHVLVEGEIWRAVSSEPVPAGASLRVIGLDKYLLRVEPASPQRTNSPPI